jgi:hypothetical protein
MAGNGKHASGQLPAKIITDNFTEIKKLNNKTNQKIYRCNYCADDSTTGKWIEN